MDQVPNMTLSTEQLLEHSHWARSLARHLVGDAAEADDIVQDAWMTALSGPPPKGALRPWLGGVIRKLVLMGRRSYGRRAARERAAAQPETLPTTDELVEHAETKRRLVDAVLALDEPYRSVVMLRYFENCSSAEIARDRGVPAGTVRSQLQEGLGRLRGSLNRSFGGDGAAWSAALVPLSQVKLVAASGASVQVFTGMFLMHKAKVSVALVAIALLAIPASLYLGNSPDAQGQSTTRAASLQSGDVLNAAEQPSVTAAREGEREAINAPDGIKRFDILAQRAGTEDSVAGAEVFYYVFPDGPATLTPADQEAMRRDDVEFYREHGLVLHTDTNGVCTIPSASTASVVVVRLDDLFAKAYVPPAQNGSMTVLLAPDHDLVVTALTADKRPAADVQVMMFNSKVGLKETKVLGRTGADGRLHRRHIQTMVAWGNLASFIGVGAGIEAVRADVDILAVPRVEVTLQMPPSGTITVELQDASGAPYDLRGQTPPFVTYSMQAERDSRDTPGRRAPGQRDQRIRLDAKGRLLIQNVVLGQFYELRIPAFKRQPLIGPGPTPENLDVVVPIRVSGSYVTVRGRAVDSDGTPITNAEFVASFRMQGGATYRTNADGVFVISLSFVQPGHSIAATGAIRADVRKMLASKRLGSHGPALTCLIADGLIARAGMNELGDVTFAPPPLVLSGRLVVSKELESTQKVHWVIQEENTHPQRGRFAEDWIRASSAFTIWHDGRRFEVRGSVAKRRKLRIQFQEDAHRAREPIEFAVGTKNLEIHLEEGGTVTATMLASTAAPNRSMAGSKYRVRLAIEGAGPARTSQSGSRQQAMADQSRLRGTGEGKLAATWRSLDPGVYRLTVDSAVTNERLVAIGGIRVTRGPVRDERLVNIDLLSKTREIEITVKDPAGQELTDANARVLICSGPDSAWTTQHLTNGKLKFRIARPVKIRILAKGYRRGSRDDVGANEEIQLERAPKLRLDVRWPLDIPDGVVSQIRLVPRNRSSMKKGIAPGKSSAATRLLWESRVEDVIKSGGAAVVRPAILGTHSVFIEMEHRDQTYYLLPSPRVVEVNGMETEAIVLEVSEKRLRAILEKIDKR